MRDGDIVVVEDERIVALHLRHQLVKLGYKVAGVASSGEEALRLIKQLHPAVVLMDIHIDGALDGIETASRVPQDLGTMIVFVSANAEEVTLERARTTNPYGYLVKPFTERELHATIQMALERREFDTELRTTQGLLKRERDVAQRYLDIASVILLELDLSGNVTLINRLGCRILEYDGPHEKIIGRNWFDTFIPEDARDEAREAHRRLVAGKLGDVRSYFGRIVTNTGRERLVAWHSSALLDTAGSAIGSLSSGEDITERRLVEEQLRQAQKMEAIGQLSAGVAHDFNNLLQGIIANLELLDDEVHDRPIAREIAGSVLRIADHAAELTRHLLSYSRQQMLQPTELDLRTFFREFQSSLSRTLDPRVRVAVMEEPDLPPVLVDETYLHTALLNRNRGRSVTLLGAFGLVPDVVGDGRGRHGGARFSVGGCSYD